MDNLTKLLLLLTIFTVMGEKNMGQNQGFSMQQILFESKSIIGSEKSKVLLRAANFLIKFAANRQTMEPAKTQEDWKDNYRYGIRLAR